VLNYQVLRSWDCAELWGFVSPVARRVVRLRLAAGEAAPGADARNFTLSDGGVASGALHRASHNGLAPNLRATCSM
jgi:hypothetical protein